MTELEKTKFFAVDVPEVVKMYHYSGDFESEIRAIDMFLERNTVPEILKQRLLLQKNCAEELLHDYELSDDQFLEILNKAHPETKLDIADLDEICQLQNVDYILRQGKRAWQYQQASNFLNQHADFFAKKSGQVVENTIDNSFLEHMAKNGGSAYKFHFKIEFSINESAIISNQKIRVWLPFPAICESQAQSEIKVISGTENYKLTGKDLTSFYVEKYPLPGETIFEEVEFVNRAKYNCPDDVLATKTTIEDIKNELPAEEYEKFTSEKYPQIIKTPFLKMLADEIIKNAGTAAEKVFKIYNYICKNVKYSYLRDYYLIPNIAEFVAINGYGDCGAMGLLFINLCRICGIPAAWESGNSIKPGHFGSHDWCRFYIAGKGWMYCDPSYGVSAEKYGNSYKKMHYFCNIDPFRMVTCKDFLVELTPAKKLFRMDHYDNQSGEAEYADACKNIGYEDKETRKILISCEEIL